MEKRLLFICTGNYYRSRFAEYYVRHLIQLRNLPLQVTSRGLRLHAGNVGGVSPHTLQFCVARGITADDRQPLTLSARDLEEADVSVAMSESEHYPLMASMFPRWVNKIQYWDIDDIPLQVPADALAAVVASVEELIARLTRSG
jgi:protein-tyrosine phosphatase